METTYQRLCKALRRAGVAVLGPKCASSGSEMLFDEGPLSYSLQVGSDV